MVCSCRGSVFAPFFMQDSNVAKTFDVIGFFGYRGKTILSYLVIILICRVSTNYCSTIKGAKTDPCNYKPISLHPIISKVMESIIASDIKSFLFCNGLISDHQFGFRPGHSTLDMLLLLSQQWMEVLNAIHEIRAISLDISRAFDTVWHCPAHQTLFL